MKQRIKVKSDHRIPKPPPLTKAEKSQLPKPVPMVRVMDARGKTHMERA